MTNPANWDHTFPVEFNSNVFTDVTLETAVLIHRPNLKRVNIADCTDMQCDSKKKFMVIDLDGSFFGGAGSTILPESEYEWDGVTRNSVTYTDTADGLGDYRIPAPMQTNSAGGKIPMEHVYTESGIIRNENCIWKSDFPGRKNTIPKW